MTNIQNQIAGYIDHTILKPDASVDAVKKICEEAMQYHFASVCVNPVHVKLVAKLLHGSDVKVCTVVGFPLGANETNVKSYETRVAIENGAEEIDMVINIGALKDQNYNLVLDDIRAVVNECDQSQVLCKVIIEAALLSDAEKRRACEICIEAGAQFVKTSTGFGPGGATVEDVELMSAIVKNKSIGVKAAGGIKTYEDAMKMIQAGATRIGASAGVQIVKEASK